MKHRIAAAAAALTLALGADGFAPSSRWEIAPAHSNASFPVRHLMVSNVRGEFAKLGGGLEVVGDDVNITIDVELIKKA